MASIIKADTLQSTTANVFVLNSSGTEYARFDSTGIPTFLKAASGGITVQVFTSGSGTYTKPTNCKYIHVKMCAGGGGGGGSNSAGGSSTGGTGGNSTFGTSLLTCNAGAGGAYNTGALGGTATIGAGATGIGLAGGGGVFPGIGYSLSVSGGQYWSGGNGGSNPFGGAGQGRWGSFAGGAGATNTGAGAGGGGADTTNAIPGTGGGAGGYIEAIITSPSETYSYAVGAGGIAGTAGTNGFAGGAGGSGVIIVTEYYV